MTIEEILKTLRPWLAKVNRPAWKPVVEKSEGAATASRFGGAPWIGSDAPWPECSECKKAMPLFIQLDLDELPEELGKPFGSGLLQLFYCTGDCECGWEPFNTVSHVRIVHPAPEEPSVQAATGPAPFPTRSIVGWTRFDDRPDPGEFEELGLNSTYDFDAGTIRLQCPEVDLDLVTGMGDVQVEEIATCKSGDKLGGWPAWVQGVEYPSCPLCQRRMILVFQVDSEDNIPFMFGDAGCGHITQCPEHKEVVAFGWACC